MIDTIRDTLHRYLNLSPAIQTRLLNSLLIILVLILLRWALLHLVNRRFGQDHRSLYSRRKLTEYIVVILGFMLVGPLWLENIQSAATYLGLVSAGLAIALQDLIVNLAGWGFIIWRRPFSVGDRIQLTDHAGDVIDVRLFSFSLLEIAGRVDAEQSTGRIIHIPNGKVFREPIANYNQGLPYIWNEIPVRITFESNWEKAKSLLKTVVNEHAPPVEEKDIAYTPQTGKRFVITYENVTPTVYARVFTSGVLLTLRYLIPPRQRRNSEQKMWEAILQTFNQHDDISFAYETYREFRNWREGKTAAAGNVQPPGMPAAPTE